MAPRKPAIETSTAVEPTRRSTRIAEKPKPAVEEKAAPKPRAKKAADSVTASKKREAEGDAENGGDADNKKKRGSVDEASSRSAKKVHTPLEPLFFSLDFSEKRV